MRWRWGALQEYLPLGRFNELETRSFEALKSELRGSIQKGIDFVHKSEYLLHSHQVLMHWERRFSVGGFQCMREKRCPKLMHVCDCTPGKATCRATSLTSIPVLAG